MKDLNKLTQVRLPNFNSYFISDENFKVSVGSTLSDNFEQEEGVSQGRSWCVTLFSFVNITL